MSLLVDVTEAGWEHDVLGCPLPILVDVWAPWCLPCKRVEPMVVNLAERFEGRLVCARLNADEAPNLVGRYELLSLPTLLLFSGGEPAGRVVGVPKPDKLVALVEPYLPEG